MMCESFYAIMIRSVICLLQLSMSCNFCGITAFENTVRKTSSVRAVIVILARNDELERLRDTLAQFEHVFNNKFHYPYVFLNNEYHSSAFQESITSMLVDSYPPSSRPPTRSVRFGKIPEDQWSYPEFIDRKLAAKKSKWMADFAVHKGGLEHYRFMCRFFSGFFYRHPLLQPYEFYWRLEPGVRFTCEIEQDPFIYMKSHNIEYGFIQVLEEIPLTVSSLWDTTKEYLRQVYSKAKSNRKIQAATSALKLVLSGSTVEKRLDYIKALLEGRSGSDEAYSDIRWTQCHYWNNFEIARLSFFQSTNYTSFFDYLDKSGGFFYERWGDAPVHSLAVALFLDINQIHHFGHIGYQHDEFSWCPAKWVGPDKCSCDHLYDGNFDQPKESTCMKLHKGVIVSQ